MKQSYSTFFMFILLIVSLVVTVLGFAALGFTHPLPWVALVALVVIIYKSMQSIDSEYIDWVDQYNVGIKLIDGDHKKLVGLLNQVINAAHHYMGDDYVKSIIKELIDYTKYHFEREEELMKDNGYPDLVNHQKQHSVMVNQIEEFSSKIDNSGCEEKVCMEIYQYLRQWLLNHITHTDKELGKYLISKGVK